MYCGVQGQSFNLSCTVMVEASLGSKVTIMWKHEDSVLQANDIRYTVLASLFILTIYPCPGCGWMTTCGL